MSTPKPRIAIVGLGLVGSSLGLALRQAEVTSTVVGHDRDRLLANEAKSRGAVDRTEWNLISAVEKSDIVTVPYPHLRAHETVLDLVCRLLLEKKTPRALH